MLEYIKTKEEREAFIDKYDNFLFDCDGNLTLPFLNANKEKLKQKK